MEALGIILAFICRSAPYAEFRAAKIIKAVQHQLSSGCHVCIIEDDRLVAYAGWLPINARDGEKWLEGNVTLKPAPSSNTDAAALTIVSVTSTSQIPQLIRGCRRLAPQRTIFFKRDYLGGRSKKSKVYNRA
jgi:hemolysin-activating ACP:hemolysin acyltransferase